MRDTRELTITIHQLKEGQKCKRRLYIFVKEAQLQQELVKITSGKLEK